mmetsp:Transcript_18767/g.46493  ORF Transcript_18767/g.46493 Transcript_18767/m.46493 type:complete len:80 (+) Transcript_18767:266-505(+)
MLSLCRQFSSSLALRQTPAACLSTTASAAAPQSEEVVQVLKLNMLKDNPGAVKKVGGRMILLVIMVEEYPLLWDASNMC